jgi:antitoxin Xre/MbcA/ParS-like protein
MRLANGESQGSEYGSEQIAIERVDRLAEWLEMTLGTRLTAFSSGLTTRELVRIARGDDEPGAAAEQSLRNLYAVASLLAARDGAGSAYAWLTEPNEELGGRSPASVLHEGGKPEAVWFAAAPTF